MAADDWEVLSASIESPIPTERVDECVDLLVVGYLKMLHDAETRRSAYHVTAAGLSALADYVMAEATETS